MKKPKLDTAEIYRRNCIISKSTFSIKARRQTPIYKIGFEFEITPISKMCLKLLVEHLNKLAELNKKSMNPNEGIGVIRNWQQKRKFKRLAPNEKMPIEIFIEGEKCELLNISIGGLRIKTKKHFKYGEDPLITIKFPEHELNFSTRIANIIVEGENK